MVNNSEDSDNERSSTDNFDSSNVTYEFPDGSLETAAPFSLPETEYKSSGRSLETEIFNTRKALNTNSLDQCRQSGACRSIKTIAEEPKEDFKHDDCVIQIEDELAKNPSSEAISEVYNFNEDLSKDVTCDEGGQIRRFSLNSEEAKQCPVSGLFNGSIEQSSSSENCFADFEDNNESLTFSSDDLTKLYENNYNYIFPMKCDLGHKSDDKISAEQNVLCHNPIPIVTEEVEAEASTSSTSQNHLKARSDVTRNKKRKCGVCKKRLNLAAITCRCGGVYCSKHRYNNEHGCTFDYKAMGAEKIKKENPQIIAEKVKKL